MASAPRDTARSSCVGLQDTPTTCGERATTMVEVSLTDDPEMQESDLRRLYPPLEPVAFVGIEVSVGCRVCSGRGRTHARMAVVRYGVPDFSLERSRRRFSPANAEVTKRWWVSPVVKKSVRNLRSGGKWELLPTTKPDGSKVVNDREIFTGGGIELACSHTGCRNRPRVKVADLVTQAKMAATSRVDRIYI